MINEASMGDGRMNYIFRKIQANDAASLLTLFKGIKAEQIDMSFAEISQIEEILAFVDNPSELTYVAVSTDEPNRVLSIVKGRRELTAEKRHAVFLSAATHPLARGQGLAAKLTQFALEDMKKEGVTIARIYVYSDNQASLNSIQKLDFTLAGTVLRHHRLETGEYIDDLIYHKVLD